MNYFPQFTVSRSLAKSLVIFLYVLITSQLAGVWKWEPACRIQNITTKQQIQREIEAADWALCELRLAVLVGGAEWQRDVLHKVNTQLHTVNELSRQRSLAVKAMRPLPETLIRASSSRIAVVQTLTRHQNQLRKYRNQLFQLK